VRKVALREVAFSRAGEKGAARIVAPLTALRIGINGRSRTHAGIRITRLPDGDLLPPLKK
jgi:hypothetical protein